MWSFDIKVIYFEWKFGCVMIEKNVWIVELFVVMDMDKFGGMLWFS